MFELNVLLEMVSNVSTFPSARTSCDSPTVKLPPSKIDTAVMSPAALRNVVIVTVAVPPELIVNGTVPPSLCNSEPEIVTSLLRKKT
eukprot:SAG22_NODE_706_length_7763_cov_4.404228_12_plen_87_part_00